MNNTDKETITEYQVTEDTESAKTKTINEETKKRLQWRAFEYMMFKDEENQ